MLVLDLDSQHAQEMAQALSLFAEPTLIVETHRGHHIYGVHPGGRIGNGKLQRTIDVRADAGYVLLPPSVHPMGTMYRALGTIEQIRKFPEVVEAMLRRDDRGSMPARREARPPLGAGISSSVQEKAARSPGDVARAIERQCVAVAAATQGSRNDELNRAAFLLAELLAAGQADPESVARLLRLAASHAGLPEDEIQRTIRSAFVAQGVGT